MQSQYQNACMTNDFLKSNIFDQFADWFVLESNILLTGYVSYIKDFGKKD